jgi:hypothetical protein
MPSPGIHKLVKGNVVLESWRHKSSKINLGSVESFTGVVDGCVPVLPDIEKIPGRDSDPRCTLVLNGNAKSTNNP